MLAASTGHGTREPYQVKVMELKSIELFARLLADFPADPSTLIAANCRRARINSLPRGFWQIVARYATRRT
jgi:hypothetical protein